MIEILATVLHSQKSARARSRSCRFAPHKACQTVGANPIIVTSSSDWKLELAREYGADIIIKLRKEGPLRSVLRETDGKGADVVIEAAGSPDAMKQANDIVRSAGRILQFGTISREVNNFNAFPIHLKELTILGSRAYTQEAIKQAIRLVNSGAIDLAPLATHEFPLGNIEEGLLTHSGNSDRLRIVIKPRHYSSKEPQ